MVDPRFMITLSGTLTVNPRFFRVPVLPLPSYPRDHVGLSLGSTRDDTDIILGDAKWHM